MNITKEQIDDLNAVIKVNLSPEDYQENVTTKLREYAKTADLKGFRKGKVPLSLVKKMVGEGVLLDEINRNLSEKLQAYITEEKLDLLGQPLPKDMKSLDLDVDANNSYEFEYEVGLSPNISVSFDLKDQPTKYEVEVDDEYLQKEIEATRKRFGEMINPDVSEEGDILYGKMTLHESASLPASSKFDSDLAVMVALNPDRMPASDFTGLMGGKKAEDVIEAVELTKLFKGDEEARQAFEMSLKRKDENLTVSYDDIDDLKKLKFNFEVKKINRMTPVEVNQDLFDKVFGPGTVSSEEEFRTKFQNDLIAAFEKDSEKLLRSKIVDHLVDANEIPLPDDFLKRWLVKSEEEFTEDNIEERFTNFSKGLKWSLIAGKIRRDNPEILVDTNAIEARIREIVSKEYMQGAAGADDETLNKMVEYFKEDKAFSERVYHELLDARIFDFVMEKITSKGEKITASNYIKLEA